MGMMKNHLIRMFAMERQGIQKLFKLNITPGGWML